MFRLRIIGDKLKLDKEREEQIGRWNQLVERLGIINQGIIYKKSGRLQNSGHFLFVFLVFVFRNIET